MAREFFEETGLAVVGEELVYVAEGYIAMFGHPFHSLRFYYRCRLDGTNRELTPDMGELKDLRWWPLAQVAEASMHDSDREALARFLKSTG